MENAYKGYASVIKRSNRDWIMNLLSFLFPFLSMVAAFAIQQVYPIGEKVMLTVDSYHQYIPFLIELRNKLVNGESLFFTWNDGLGLEYYAAFANYAASPLNFFVVFFNAKTMPVFAAAVTAVRAGLASLFMSWFLNANDKGRRDYITTAFACAYALCGWFCCDFWNVMWCDALVLLPLICLGLRKMFVEGRSLLYILSLAVCLWSNYYTGFFICIFLVLFAPIYCICIFQTSKEELCEGRLTFKRILTCAVRFAISSLLAGALTAVLLIPTYLILQNTSAVGADFPKEYSLTGNLFDFLGRFLVAANPNIRDGMANVYSGLIPVLMLPLFFASPEKTGIRLRHKICYGILILIMYLSFTNRTLNFIWHGFHFPNQIPYRESFLMSFLIVFLGFKTIRNLKCFKTSTVSSVFVGAGIFLILFEKFGSGAEDYKQILLTMLFLIIEAVVINCTMTGSKRPIFYESAVAIVMALEMLASCILCVFFVAKNEGFPSYETYGKNHELIEDYVKENSRQEGHKLLERTDILPNNICNIQSVYNVPGISVFSSTVREDFVTYMKNFGFHNNNINGVRAAGLTRVTATLLGVRNILTYDKTDSLPKLYDKVKEFEDEGVIITENPDALSIGYMVSEDLLDYTPDVAKRDVFYKTDMWLSSMGFRESVYRHVDVSLTDFVNTTESPTSGSDKKISIINSNNPSEVTAVVENATLGSDIYLYFDSGKAGTYEITTTVDGVETKTAPVAYRYYQIIPLGRFEGTPIKCRLKLPTSPSGAFLLYSYELDGDAYRKMCDHFSEEQLVIEDYSARSFRGSIDCKEGGLLLLTIAYTDSYKIYVDGEEAQVLDVQDALTAVRLTPGSHKIELIYSPEGFDLGLKISIGALLGVIAVIVYELASSGRAGKGSSGKLPLEAEVSLREAAMNGEGTDTADA